MSKREAGGVTAQRELQKSLWRISRCFALFGPGKGQVGGRAEEEGEAETRRIMDGSCCRHAMWVAHIKKTVLCK